MNDPSPRLQSRSWRWRNSVWLLGPILGCGFFTVFSFLWLARKLGDKALRRIALLVYAPATALLWLSVALSPTDPSEENAFSTIMAVMLGVLWIGGAVHAGILNRKLLTHRAASGPEMKWYEQPATFAAAQPVMPPTTAPAGWQQALGVHDVHEQAWGATPSQVNEQPRAAAGPQPAPQMAPQPAEAARTAAATPAWQDSHGSASRTGLIEMNVADEAALRQLPGVGPAVAKRIIAHRQTNGRLAGLGDLAAAGVPPHVLAGLQDKVTFDRATPAAQARRGGRVLDI